MNSIRLKVGATRFPNMKDGQIGFVSKKSDNKALKPYYPSQNGEALSYVHTRNHDELSALAAQIGAMHNNEFKDHHGIKPSGTWVNDYIRYLDLEIERALLKHGIILAIDGQIVHFYTEPGYYQHTDIKPSKRFRELYEEK
jgi:hypothetical protein